MNLETEAKVMKITYLFCKTQKKMYCFSHTCIEKRNALHRRLGYCKFV